METIKEEKKADLELLLNSLIEKGWKPWNKEETRRLNYHTLYREVISLEFDNYNLPVSYSIRDLVSKESGLWQFVFENGYNQYRKEYWEGYTKYNMKAEYWDTNDYEYYIIESALCDEDKLEDFLLSNIKVDG